MTIYFQCCQDRIYFLTDFMLYPVLHRDLGMRPDATRELRVYVVNAVLPKVGAVESRVSEVLYEGAMTRCWK